MDDAPRGGLAFGFGNRPGLRSSGDEHLAAGSADAAQRIPIGGSGSAATGALWAVFSFVEIGLLDADILPIDIQFVGNDHRKMSFDALADFGILAHDGHDAIRRYAKKRRGLEGSRRSLRGLGKNFSDRIEMESDENASAGDSGDAKKTAAIEERGLHRTPLLLARIVAGGRYDRHGWYCNAV